MEVLGQKTLWEGKFLKTISITFKDHKGVIRQWEAVSRVNCDGVVVIIPVTVDNNLLLIRQFRPVVKKHVIEFPAGLVNTGEDILTAGKRELIEETKHDSDTFIPLTEGVLSTGINSEKWTVLLAKDAKEATPELLKQYPPDETENIDVIKAPITDVYDTLEKYAKNGDYIDIKIYGLVELAKRKIANFTRP
jgi:8-oxo-dGTP pyrophosphatase MutT (NUDIX family)